MLEITDLIKSVPVENRFIISHADHDGICSAIGLNYVFGDIKTEFSLPFRPKFINIPEGISLLINNDLLLSEKQIEFILDKGIKVINLDHHDVRDIANSNYYCLNPKKLWNKQFISSSGMIWKLFRPEKIAWILAAGSAGDLCIEDNIELFEFVKNQHPELINDLTMEGIYNSKIFEIAQTILMSFLVPREGYNLLKRCIVNNLDYSLVFKSEFYSKLKEKLLKMDKELPEIKKIEHNEFVLLDSSDREFSSSYSVFAQIKSSDKRMHIEYAKGRLFFRNYLGDKSILDLAKLFGGGGAHKRAGGAYTKKSFDEVGNIIRSYFDENQRSLGDF